HGRLYRRTRLTEGYRAEHEGQNQGAHASLDPAGGGGLAAAVVAPSCASSAPIGEVGSFAAAGRASARDRRPGRQGASAVLCRPAVPSAVAQRIWTPLGRGLDAYASPAHIAVRRA